MQPIPPRGERALSHSRATRRDECGAGPVTMLNNACTKGEALPVVVTLPFATTPPAPSLSHLSSAASRCNRLEARHGVKQYVQRAPFCRDDHWVAARSRSASCADAHPTRRSHGNFIAALTQHQLLSMHRTVMLLPLMVTMGVAFGLKPPPRMIGSRNMPCRWLSAFG